MVTSSKYFVHARFVQTLFFISPSVWLYWYPNEHIILCHCDYIIVVEFHVSYLITICLCTIRQVTEMLCQTVTVHLKGFWYGIHSQWHYLDRAAS
jgi:hypothetical protein